MLSFLLVLLFGTTAWAAQGASVVASDGAALHQAPNGTTPVLVTSPSGSRIQISSKMIRDVSGVYWYKAKIPVSGGFAYIRANDVLADTLENEMRALGGVRVSPSPRP